MTGKHESNIQEGVLARSWRLIATLHISLPVVFTADV